MCILLSLRICSVYGAIDLFGVLHLDILVVRIPSAFVSEKEH